MSAIKIERDHKLGSADKAKELVLSVGEKLEERYGVTFDWSGYCGKLKGKGVTGECRLSDEKIEVELKLGLLLRPLARKIEDSIGSAIDRRLQG